MSKPDKSRLKLLAVGCGVAAVVIGASVVLFSAKAQERTETTPSEPLTYQRAPLEEETMSPATAAPATQRPVITAARPTDTVIKANTNFRGDRVNGQAILLRKPMAPAKVDWQAAMNRDDQMQKQARVSSDIKSRLPRQQLDKTRLPVILPRAGGVVDTAKAKMMSFGDAYALNMPQPQKPGVQVTVYGNRTFIPSDSGAVSKRPFARLAGVAEDIRIGQMEDGWTATFTRFGVVYSIDVTCDSMSDPDCATDAYIRNVITQMDDVTMGAEAQQEAETQIKAESNWLNQIAKTISNITRGS